MDAWGDAWDWGVRNLDPLYPVVGFYAKEVEAYENGCSYWGSVAYGLQGTGVAAVETLAGWGVAKGAKVVLGPVADWLGPRLARIHLPDNQLIRIGPQKNGGPFRVSLGAQQTHWKKLPRWRQIVQPVHVHLERARAGVTYNPTGKSWKLWGTWKK